jgi:N-acetylglucosamine-6-phosphate deacetylase
MIVKAVLRGLIVRGDEILNGHVLMYEGKDIWKIVPRKQFRAGMCTEIIDAKNGFVVPGFINEHIHGCAGADTMDEEDTALAVMQKALPATGVTSFVPTTMTYDRGRIERALERIRKAKSNAGAQILGAHMEGPFISEAYKGSQEGKHIMPPDFSWLEPYADIIKIITIAPETLKNKTFLNDCAAHGIIVSFGHSAATYEEVIHTMAAGGIYHATHLFNGMTPFHHRKPGLVGAALLQDAIHCELICDNLHVHPAAQKLAYQMKGSAGIILVTDSLRACLQGDGESELGGHTVFVKNGEARLADGTLAASVIPMNEAVLNFLINSGASLPEVIAMVTVNPAKDLGVYDRIGSLEEGKQADFVVLDSEDFHVKQTVIAGELAYNEENK